MRIETGCFSSSMERFLFAVRRRMAPACWRILLGRRFMRMLALVALVIGSGTSWAAGTPDALTLSYPESNSQYWDIDVAISKGFFADEGFTTTNITGNLATPQVIQMMISGDIQMSTPQPDALILAMVKGGHDLAVMAQPTSRPDWLLIGTKGETTLPGLKHKTLGFSALRGSEFWLTTEVLRRAGLASQDWNAIQVGLTPQKFAALDRGSIAAAVLYQPFADVAVSQGLPTLFNFAKLPPYPSAYYAVSRRWAADRQHGVRLSRAIQRAHRWLYAPEHKAEAVAILAKYTKRDTRVLETVYAQYFVDEKIYKPDAAVSRAGVQAVADALISRGDIPAGAITPADVLLPASSGGISD